MDMDMDILRTFCEYKKNVLFEELEFEKMSDSVITNPKVKLVAYYIFIQHMQDNQPSQTDILFALRMSLSTLRKILQKLISIGYIKACEKEDHRFTHYQPTEMVIEGFKIHTARHIRTLLIMTTHLLQDNNVEKILQSAVESKLGSYANQKPYGDMDLNIVKNILETMEAKKNNSVNN